MTLTFRQAPQAAVAYAAAVETTVSRLASRSES